MEEIFKDIEGYEGRYQVSNLGRVKSLGNDKSRKEKILKPHKDGCGYLQVGFHQNCKTKWYRVNRLVLMTFSPVDNMENLEVNHIDENKENNMISNLEWVTHKENMNHGTRNARVAEKLRGRTLSEEHKIKLSKPIVQIDVSTNKVVNVWKSNHDAERECGFNKGHISSCCNNKYNREGNNIYKGYKWQYLHYYISQIDPRIKKVILFGKEYDF